MLAVLQEAAKQGAKAKVHRLCVQLARNGRGGKGRRYNHVTASSPSLDEARNWLESPAVEGGMSATILPVFDSEVRKVLACFDFPSHADLNKEATARKDLRDTLRTLKKESHAQSVPAELFIMALDPLYFAVVDSIPHGLGFEKGECAELTAAKDTMFKLLVHVRCAD